MIDLRRLYFYLIFGACGGLTGWFLGTLSIRALNIPRESLVALSLYGGILGACIGIAATAYEAIMNRSLRRFAKHGGVGLALGATAGAFAIPLAQWLYTTLIAARSGPSGDLSWQNDLIATFCWLLFGGMIGLAEGISRGTQIWKGFLGGVIGGASGGFLYQITSSEANREIMRGHFFLALGLLVLGAAVSGAIALVTEVLKRAWLEILDGKYAGRTIDVTKYVDPLLGRYRGGMIGSDQWESNIYIPGDHKVLPFHAEINFVNGAPTLKVTPEAGQRALTSVNGRPITTFTPLSDGDRLCFGSTHLIYRQKMSPVTIASQLTRHNSPSVYGAR